ncbi:Protein CFT1 [Blumeria hordei DH14]|uniref:Protein CFT1 n=1 Tax=Blumeria graminis f. sp. hordei (strain DH14) TaxID=546991 RepID=N1JIN1_BLUG1|nr:Protein CFT1 [Blumeria hordei DH14]
MQCYTELSPPTAVTHSLRIPFISADSNNLLVAKTSLLQIFTTKVVSVELDTVPDVDISRRSDKNDALPNDDSTRNDRARRTKLVLIAEYTLSGIITSLVRVKTVSSKSGGEAVLIGLKDAKLSLVEWDPILYGISTISIHYYEQDDLQSSPWAPSLKDCVNYLSADPASRCAALKFGLRNLAILPFRQGDEDVNMVDWDDELDDNNSSEKIASKNVNGTATKDDRPYNASFVLPLPSLDPNLRHPIHLAFLYEYREPTFGILSSNYSPASSLLSERKDSLTYMVFTLDLYQKASTTILSVCGLPYDLTQVVALPAPVGGALLIGANELIHIDQAGKANGIAVNMFAKQCTSLNLYDQSDMEMRLEGCKIEQISVQTGEMIIILLDGKLALLSFHMDGRSVSGLGIRRVAEISGGSLIPARASCVSAISPNAVFVGSECADSVVLGWSRRLNHTNRRKSRQELSEEAGDVSLDEDDDDDADDDLYGDTISSQIEFDERSGTLNSKAGDYIFYIHDTLTNIGPILDVTFGSSANQNIVTAKNTWEDNNGYLDIIAAVGKEKSGSLVILHQNIQPTVIGRFEFPEARGIWTVNVKKLSERKHEKSNDNSNLGSCHEVHQEYDRLMIVSKEIDGGVEKSDVFALTSATFEALTGTEFEPAAGQTVEAGTLGNGMRIIQVLKSEVRSYDGDLGLAQIIPMYDDDTGAEPKVVSASFADPYLLLVRDDSSIFVAQCDDNNELEEVDRVDKILLTTKWITGCIYCDSTGVFASVDPEKKIKNRGRVMMFLLSDRGTLHIYALPELTEPVYVAESLCFVPPVLSIDHVVRRTTAKATIIEMLVADLGEEVSKSPYLILRCLNDDLTIYEPYRTKISSTGDLSSTLRFLKLYNPHLAKNPDISGDENPDSVREIRERPMKSIPNVGGYSLVFLPGASPSFILKNSKSIPKVIGLQSIGVRGISGFHTAGCERGFIYVDVKGITRVAQLPQQTSFAELGMPLRRVDIGDAVHAVTYHPPMDCYVVATSTKVDFELPKDDDHHREWAREDITFRATTEQSFLKLYNPINWSEIHTVELDPFESVLCVKTLSLEVSEITNERRQLITVGTAICKGEDLATKGRIYVFDIVAAVPEPDRPETNKRLKQIAKEEIARGAVTALSEIGTQGFMLVSQGQKCMVRGLKEDGSLLPVAFMDMNSFVTCIKELRGTGLCIFADIIKGVWLAGYTEEPYKMMLFGKSGKKMEALTAEFLPDGKELYIAVADAECNLHILQYNPEHPKSLHGHQLLHRSTFALGGHFPTTMTLLPRTKTSVHLPPSTNTMNTVVDTTNFGHQIIITLDTGCIALLSPLNEAQYRRLSTLTTHLSNTLHHACGLNPRAFRIDRDAPESMAGGRTVVDGTLLSRWNELGSQRRAEVAGRVGVDVDQIREDLLVLRGGLDFL